MMVDKVLEHYRHFFEILIIFANTGWEHEESLVFANRCDKRWQEKYGHSVIWVEAVVFKGRIACKHKVVTFETASREQEPFIEVMAKYGVANKGYPHCTRELKENPIHHYVREVGGWKKGEYTTCIGMRSDEPSRLNRKIDKQLQQFKVYPLNDWFGPTSKSDVLDYWVNWEYNLTIPEHMGNCLGCWQKSEGKLLKVYRELPEAFDFPVESEDTFGQVGKNKIRGVYSEDPRRFYRGEQSAIQMIAKFDLREA